MNTALGKLPLPAWHCRALLILGCSLGDKAHPAEPIPVHTTGPLNCLAPTGRNSLFLFCEFSQQIHVANSSAFLDRISRRKEVSFPVRVIKHLPGRGTVAVHMLKHHTSSMASLPSSLQPLTLWHNRPGPTETQQPWCQPSDDHAWLGQCEVNSCPVENFLATFQHEGCPQLSPNTDRYRVEMQH